MTLSHAERESFLSQGFLHLKQCFDCSPGSIAHRWVEDSWKRNGLNPDDPSTWPATKIHMPSTDVIPAQDIAPEAVAKILELCGGPERIDGDHIMWSNAFIANYGFGRDEAWLAPEQVEKGWHKDGDFFKHYLDSPEQALLTIIVFSDIEHKGGGTFIAPDSIPVVARFLLEHPEGVEPNDFSHAGLIKKCNNLIEVTARAGDVILMHPYMLHTSSFNHSQTARLIINPCCKFKEPMQFNRERFEDFSLVELAVLRALEMERLDFQIQGEREARVPGRIARQQALLQAEKGRLRQSN
jgi:ectoine hydroxylase-related dioxygenase (phytanoyl-CoA dioxygenase family)